MKYLLYIFILFALGTSPVFAGSIDFNIENDNSRIGDEILIDIVLKTEGQSYNTVSGKLEVGPDFEIRKIKTGNSVISAWIENPSESKSGQINFSGIIAGGFNGDRTIFKLIIVPKKEGSLRLSITDISILLNDGLGTEEKKENKYSYISVRPLSSEESNIFVEIKDTTPPEEFEVILAQDPNIEGGKYVLIFEATDKDSGVKTYEVIEGKKIFKQASSPYVLVNQKINERIYVKAIDYSGNERIVKVYTSERICIWFKCFDQRLSTLILIITFILSLILWRHQSQELEEISEKVYL